MNTLDGFFAARPPSQGKGCVVCGAKAEVRLQVQIREHASQKYGRGRHRSLGFCAEHGTERFDVLTKELERR